MEVLFFYYFKKRFVFEGKNEKFRFVRRGTADQHQLL